MQLCEVLSGIVEYQDVLQYFVKEWAPVVNELHTSKCGPIRQFISEVVNITKTLPTNKVWHQ